MTIIDGGFLLEKPSGETHEVTVGPDGRAMCSCKDWRFRHSGPATDGCLHIKALRSVDLIDPGASFPDSSSPATLPAWADELTVAQFFGMA